MTSTATPRGVLILAGGRGERFWPWSTPERPKQLLPLAHDGRTLLASTFMRARRIAAPEHIVVMTSMALVEACRQECPGAIVVGEPVGRNTAPAIAAAAACFQADQVFAVMPADHAIPSEDAFAADLETACAWAERESVLVTFGIRPTHPETNFGYIQRGTSMSERVHRVARFKEKPDRATAEAWLATGQYAWNSGIFVWRKSAFFGALEAGRPAIAQALSGLTFQPGQERAFEAAIARDFAAIESVSVDVAVLESASNVLVVDAAFDWDDLGSWSAWARRQPKDARGNVAWGEAVVIDCDECVVVGDGGIAAALGLRRTVVVHAHGATLACPLDRSEHVRRVAEAVRARTT